VESSAKSLTVCGFVKKRGADWRRAEWVLWLSSHSETL
jgi:hypothetical protein